MFTSHAKICMRQRRFTPLEILEALRKGSITEGPLPDLKGCWRCTMQRFAAGENLTAVVTICSMTLVVIANY